MWLSAPPLATVFRHDGEPVNDRRLRARIDSGAITRISPGSFVDSHRWRQLTPLAQHAQRVWETAVRLRGETILSHWSAAALHGIDILGAWPAAIDVSIAAAAGGRSSGMIRRHTRDLAGIVTSGWQGHRVTVPLQTAVDLTASLPFIEAVAVADQALWARRVGGALVQSDALLAASHSQAGRGSARAARAADFGSPLADSVRESQSRVLIALMGFPEPELQARFVLLNGREAFTDFFWRDHGHIGEFDGAGKYRDPALLRGRSPEEVLLAEKDQEDELRRQVRAFSRWRLPALKSPRLLYDILHGAGLPTTKRRPGR